MSARPAIASWSTHPFAVPLRDELPTQDPILGQVHVGRENACITTVHSLSKEVLLQRPFAAVIVGECSVAVC